MKNLKFAAFLGKPKFCGSARNSAGRGKLWALGLLITKDEVDITS